MPESALRRTVPFLGDHATFDGKPRIMIDYVTLKTTSSPDPRLVAKIISNLDLAAIGAILPEEVCSKLIEEQYGVCLEYIYSHPVWEALRAREGQNEILAYLLETRHYLHSASSRMAPGVAAGWRDGGLLRLLARHVVEEADHARFFDQALNAISWELEQISLVRPSPISLEWIFLMRTLSSRDPLIAAICSGLMETSAADHLVVEDWHRMLLRRNLLPAAAVDAIFEHVSTDVELGHGQNWREALKMEAPLTSDKLRDCLNSACAAAEMIHRWLTHLQCGLSSTLVPLVPSLAIRAADVRTEVDPIFDGTPVWPAEILHCVSHGSELSKGTGAVLALAYYVGEKAKIGDTDIERRSELLRQRLLSKSAPITSAADMAGVLKTWLCAIDGHRLWSEMAEFSAPALLYGWVLENYFYFSSACRHVCAAIASCPDPLIRSELLTHLSEEADHADLLRSGLESVDAAVPIDLCRPLPTTLAFLGYLREIASLDWKAYCLALVYIQLSLSPNDDRYKLFFETLNASAPKMKLLLQGMLAHDELDNNLGHNSDSLRLLSLLFQRHSIDQSSIKRAAVLADLSWSFLDGIRCHYTNGPISIFQRLGWSSRNLA
jgi:pyrroloquinoline quinone (PQQ) biosynthesis protein C